MANIAQAIRLALHVGESRLGVTDIFGEDVGPPLGGVFTATQGLKTAWNTPLDERGIVGTAFGLALAGQRAVAESTLRKRGTVASDHGVAIHCLSSCRVFLSVEFRVTTRVLVKIGLRQAELGYELRRRLRQG